MRPVRSRITSPGRTSTLPSVGGRVEVVTGDRVPVLDLVDAASPGDVEEHAPAHERRDLVDAQAATRA